MKSRLTWGLALALATGVAPAAAFAAPAVPVAPAAPAPAPDGRAQLSMRSILPTATYTPASETSGHFVTGKSAIPAPFPGQPVQGFSATHRLGDGSYLVMADNGFGAKANSPDAQLAVHRIRPAAGKDGKPGVTSYLNTVFTLSDPHQLIPWRIWRDGGCTAETKLPAGYTCPTTDRTLTGWDFDLESMQVAPDGTFWFGEEFGPYLLHTDQLGRLLAPPIPTPGVKSPSNPTLAAGESANLPNSKGFEGMAMSPDGRTLYPLLEGPTQEDVAAGRPADLRLFKVAIGRRDARFTGMQWRYKMESPQHAIGDLVAVNDHQFLVIERDNAQGAGAKFKRIYLVDIAGVKREGYVAKTLVADLMDVADPKGIGGSATSNSRFTFPFFTIEDVAIVDDSTIAVMNDNNFPATGGRSATAPDENEYIELTLPKPLKVDRRVLGSFVPYGPQREGRGATTLSVIGDIPYGPEQVAKFPGWIDDINAGHTDGTVHVGDIKSGSTLCDDATFALVKAQFDRLTTPLVYTPGDNEWTDCHRANNGSYNPLERLATLRKVFFARPGVTNGKPTAIASQAAAGYPENVSWRMDRVSFAALHVVGSNDSLEPWTGKTAPTPEQLAEQKGRMAKTLSLLRQSFKDARARHDRAVVLFMQADMFDPTYAPKAGTNRAFVPLVEALIKESRDFRGPVYLVDGDSHVFNVDRPLATGSRWLDFYGVKGAADNLTRVTVDGSANNTNWLKVTINRKGAPLSWVQVPYRK